MTKLYFGLGFLLKNSIEGHLKVIVNNTLTQLDSVSTVTTEFVPLLLYTDMQGFTSGNLVWKEVLTGSPRVAILKKLPEAAVLKYSSSYCGDPNHTIFSMATS